MAIPTPVAATKGPVGVTPTGQKAPVNPYGPQPDPRAVLTPHGWVDPPYTPQETKTFNAKNPPTRTTAVLPKTGKGSAFQKWLNTYSPHMGSGPGGYTFDPLAGQPGPTTLDAFPTMPSITDGSAVQDAPSTPLQLQKAALLDPKSYAAMMGQKAYQPIIDQLGQQQASLKAGIPTASGIIDKGFGDAAAQDTAGRQSILDATGKASQGLTDLAARMAAAAGGDPTAAAAITGQTGNAQAALQGFSNIAATGQTDQAAAAARDSANAKLGYSTAANSKVADLGQTAAQAKVSASQAGGKAIMDALGFNSNQETAQQGRDVAKYDAYLAAALAGRQVTAADLANASARQRLQLNAYNSQVNNWQSLTAEKQTQYTNSVNRWAGANAAKQLKMQLQKGQQPAVLLALADPTARAAVAQDVLGPLMGKGPYGPSPVLQPDKLWVHIQTALRTSYGDAPPRARAALAKIFMEQTLNQWVGNHPNATHKWIVDASGAPHLVKKTN